MPTEEHLYLLRRIENIMYEHPGVMDVAAIFIPGPGNQETLTAYVVPASKDVTEKELAEHLITRLSPRSDTTAHRVRLVSSIPKTASGKVHKLKLISEN